MDDLLLHPRTKMELSALLADPPHALLLVAPAGMGKRTLALAWAANITVPEAISIVEPDEKGTITIDATRALYQRTRAKQKNHQVVLIDHAEAMGTEAQNAFLKLLEEPRGNLTFILTAPGHEDLLPTIASRVQTITVQPVAPQALTAFAKKTNAHTDDATLNQLLFVAQGRPATLATMLHNPAAFDYAKQIMQQAKHLLGASQYERLALVQTLCKDKTELVAVLEAFSHMLKLQMSRGTGGHWLALTDAVQECLRRVRQNGNPRAQLVHLFMQY